MSRPKPVSATHVRAALSSAWNAAEKDESLSGALAGHYHHALMEAFQAATVRQWLRASQAEGSLHAFLAMERRCDSRDVHKILKHILRSGDWLEENFTGSLARTVFRRYPFVLQSAARQTVTDFTASQTEDNLRRMLKDREFPARQLLKENLSTLWSVWYVPKAIRSSLSLLLALQPKDEYPEARAMHRHFILHIGGTNTGKTYAGFQRLAQAETGVYLAPLRLLALEAQETLLDAGVDCALSTGEEEDFREEDTHVAATAEKLDLHRRYEVAVIDECQMIADRQRGYAWTRAILGVQAPEVHLCAAPEAKNLLLRLIESCSDSYEVEIHRRQTPLLCMSHPVDLEHVQPGDALITFSKVGKNCASPGRNPPLFTARFPIRRAANRWRVF